MTSQSSISSRRKKKGGKKKEEENSDAEDVYQKDLQELAELQRNSLKYAEKFFTVNGENYTIRSRPYAKQIYEDDSEYVLLLWGRSLTKSTIATNKMTHKLIVNPGTSCLASAPTDQQAWRLTKECFRPNIMYSRDEVLVPLIKDSEGMDQIGEIDLTNHSKWSAKGAFGTGNSLRGPHRNWGILDEMQDWSRTAFIVAREVINLIPHQFILMGTGGPEGSIWHELWMKSDQKEWNGRRWVPQNKDAEPGYSGYHATQFYSPFENKKTLENKRKDYPKTLWLTEVMAEFFSSAGMKPAPYELTRRLLINDQAQLDRLGKEIKKTAIGVDWGFESHWVYGAQLKSGQILILEVGVWGEENEEFSHKVKKASTPLEDQAKVSERRAKKHVKDAALLIDRYEPDIVLCDAGWSHNKNQELMQEFGDQVWAVTTGDRKDRVPKWTITKEDGKKRALPRQRWENYVDLDHSNMCEMLETRIETETIWIADPKDSQIIERLLTSWNMADIIEVETREKIVRKYSISKAHYYAAACYMLAGLAGKRRSKLLPGGF